MKFKSLAVVAALLAGGVAHAAGGSLALVGTTFSSVAVGGSDVWTLSLPTVSVGSVTSFSISGGGLTGITFTTAAGATVPGLVSSVSLPYVGAFAFSNLAAGNYKLTVSGTVGAAYGVTTAITSAVPESGSVALALAGLGVAGLMLRRRSA